MSIALSFRQIHSFLTGKEPLPPQFDILKLSSGWIGRSIQLFSISLRSSHVRKVDAAYQVILEKAEQEIQKLESNIKKIHTKTLSRVERVQWQNLPKEIPPINQMLMALTRNSVCVPMPPSSANRMNLLHKRLVSISQTICLHIKTANMLEKASERFISKKSFIPIVFPKLLRPLAPAIEPLVLPNQDTELLYLQICRKVNELLQSPSLTPFSSIKKDDVVYSNNFPSSYQESQLSSSFNSGSRLSQKALRDMSLYSSSYSPDSTHPRREVSVVIKKENIGVGGFKKVKTGLELEFSPIPQSPYFSLSAQQVVASVSKESSRIRGITNGIEIHRQILSKVASGVKPCFAPLPKHIRKENESIELIYPWFPGDLLKAATRKRLPVDIHRTSYKRVDIADLFLVLVDVCKALKAMHRLGWIHHDVKSTNILVEYSNRRWRGRLADFDLVSREGYSSGGKYDYWSRCAQIGYDTKESTDGFGLVMTLGELFFLNDFHRFRNDRNLIEASDYQHLLIDFLYRHNLETFQDIKDSLHSPLQGFDAILERAKTLSEAAMKPNTKLSDKHLFNLLTDILTDDKFTSIREKIHNLMRRLQMFQMVHSFIQSCVKKDKQIYDQLINSEYIINRNQSLEQKNASVLAFKRHLVSQYTEENTTNVFDIDVIEEMILAMYKKLKSQ